MNLHIEQIPVGPLGANCYILENTDTGECLIVDPGGEAERIRNSIGPRKPKAVFLTHAHWDHIAAVDEICEGYGIPLYVHELDAPKLLSSEENLSTMFGCPIQVHTKPELLREGDEPEIAGITLRVLHTPGHSVGSVCYLLPDHLGILTGDTLFAHGYGRTDFPDGNYSQIIQSLRRLFKLTPEMTAYPGHDVAGKVGRNE